MTTTTLSELLRHRLEQVVGPLCKAARPGSEEIPAELRNLIELACEFAGDTYLHALSVAGHGAEGATLHIEVVDMAPRKDQQDWWQSFAQELSAFFADAQVARRWEVDVSIYGPSWSCSTWGEDG